ncbi:MAG: radical SAM protein [Spirochaetales bacterium]|nr:radical SAM protein [Spirochaetales bacterium]
MTDFPQSISFTITNRCNLKCRMCGQWSKEGYMRQGKNNFKDEMSIVDWKRLVDECAEHEVSSILLRGGEIFLVPGIMDLISYIRSKDIFLSIDTNGTQLSSFADDLVRLGKIHLSVSVDGPQPVHDMVRGVKGCYESIKKNIEIVHAAEKKYKQEISISITFTISKYSVKGLGVMPQVAEDLGIKTITIVPYYYFPKAVGLMYEKELLTSFHCPAFSWKGFHHEESGVDFREFQTEFREYIKNLNNIYSYPYMPLTEDQYRDWFRDPQLPVGPQHCTNVEKLIDIQPRGDANFCVDFPDYSMGNVKESTIATVWNSDRAKAFREYRRKKPFAVCYRCGAKYMSEIKG